MPGPCLGCKTSATGCRVTPGSRVLICAMHFSTFRSRRGQTSHRILDPLRYFSVPPDAVWAENGTGTFSATRGEDLVRPTRNMSAVHG